LRLAGVVVQRRLCGCGIGGEKRLEECEWMDALPFCCLHQAGDDAMGLEPQFGSRSEAYFAEDYQLSQRLLGMIIGRGHPWDAKKGKEVFLFRADEIGSQGFGRLETKRLFANGLDLSEEAFFDLSGRVLGNVAGFKFLADVACPGEEVLGP